VPVIIRDPRIGERDDPAILVTGAVGEVLPVATLRTPGMAASCFLPARRILSNPDRPLMDTLNSTTSATGCSGGQSASAVAARPALPQNVKASPMRLGSGTTALSMGRTRHSLQSIRRWLGQAVPQGSCIDNGTAAASAMRPRRPRSSAAGCLPTG